LSPPAANEPSATENAATAIATAKTNFFIESSPRIESFRRTGYRQRSTNRASQYYANCDATVHVARDPASIGHHGLEAHCTPPTAAQFAPACPFIHGTPNKQVKRKKEENPNRFTAAPERRFKHARTDRAPQAWQ